MSRDAVLTAGRLAGLSTVVRRSVFAAGEAVTRDLDPAADDELPSDPQAVPSAPAAPAMPAVLATPAARIAGDPPSPKAPTAVPEPTLTITPEQHDFLVTGATATLAVNDPSGAPQLTSSIYHWDGSTLRLPGTMFTARATNIDRDPRVSMLIEDAASGAWLAVTGVASMVHGDEAIDDLTFVLSKYLEPDAVEDRLQEMRSSGDHMVIRIRPTRLVWRPA
jgi:PPOX class probable F420-dependent enzyme